MTDRERLIELVWNSIANRLGTVFRENVEDIADDLLANGVIVPSCKVGDIVYVVSRYYTGSWEIYECEICEITIYEKNTFMKCEKGRKFVFGLNAGQIGKTVFLTKEEAEQALKERDTE